jgi:elongation factor 4
VNREGQIEMGAFKPSKIRNFCITAHIDHGKTTLSTKLLEMSGTINKSKMNALYLDKLRVEKERGITVKAQTATMFYDYDGETYLLNLIDTPGHVDFTYEVSRSMTACEGALLLVDAVKGVQAQSVANWWLAMQNSLTIIPAINKIDLNTAQPEKIVKQLSTSLGFNPDQILKFSAVTGVGLDMVFPSIVEIIPPPEDQSTQPFKALLFDSWYQDIFIGVICLVKVAAGKIKAGDKITAASTGKSYDVTQVGVMHPEPVPTDALFTGQVGYIKIGMKSTKEARVGDTFHATGTPVEPFSGFKQAKPMVFAGLYPDEDGDFSDLKDAIEKLTLTDASVTLERDVNDVLGMGYRCGFLGLLHMDVFLQRLREEYGVNVIATAPNVPIKLEIAGEEAMTYVTQASQWPEQHNIRAAYEPIVNATIFVPKEYLGSITQLCLDRRGVQTGIDFIDETRVHLSYTMPLSEVIFDFFDKLKSLTSGYATFDYEDAGVQTADLVKLNILLNGIPADPLSVICHRGKAESTGRRVVEKLKEVIRRQMFEVRIQAAIGNKIIARETVKAFRKDVTAKCYGGDITRKRKLLEKQKEGKKRMKSVGNVELTSEAFMVVTKL